MLIFVPVKIAQFCARATIQMTYLYNSQFVTIVYARACSCTFLNNLFLDNMIIVISILALIIAALVYILLRQQKQSVSAVTAEAELKTKEALIEGRDSLIEQKNQMLAHMQARVSSLESELAERSHAAIDARKENENLRNQIDSLKGRIADAQAESAALTERLDSARKELQVKQEAADEQRKNASEHFRNVANEIFQMHTASFRENSERRLSELLEPLKTNLEGFKKEVTEAYNREARERFSLQTEIKNLMDLNRTIGEEAQHLTRALKGDSKVQGDWGEMILERMLEMSGLKKGIHFDTQVTVNPDGSKITDTNGRQLRPDVVVYYPDGRCVVIDSKVSLSAYIDYINSDSKPDESMEASKRHLASVRRHIAELSEKKYQDLVGDKKLDFVMMFIPNEGAYMALMQIQPYIWEEAYAKRVLLTSPTHLIAALKMLEQLWKQDAATRNVQEIARLSGTMLDKFTNFMSDLDNISKHLDAATSAYNQARKRMADGNGNIMITARKIVALGAKTSKASEIARITNDAAISEGEN